MDAKFGTLDRGIKQIQSPTVGAHRSANSDSQTNAAADVSDQIRHVSNPKRNLGSPENENLLAPRIDTLPEDDAESLDRIVAQLNEQVQRSSRSLQFSVDERQGKPVVLVVDKDTDKIIRQIPSEVALQVADALEESANAGALVSEHA